MNSTLARKLGDYRLNKAQAHETLANAHPPGSKAREYHAEVAGRYQTAGAEALAGIFHPLKI